MNEQTVQSTVLVSAFTALLIVGSLLSLPVPWNPGVPFTMATMFVVLSGMLLGPWKGLAVTGLYFFLGACGLPVFANASGGIHVFAGPTGGFLIGYAPAAVIAGLISRLGPNNFLILSVAAVSGMVAIYLPGVPWMHWRLTGSINSWSWASTWGQYTAPFLVLDAIKAVAAAAIVRALKNRTTPYPS